MKEMSDNEEGDADRMAVAIISFIKVHQRATPSRVLTYVRKNCRRTASIQNVSKRMQIMRLKGILMSAKETNTKKTVYWLNPDRENKDD